MYDRFYQAKFITNKISILN